MADSTISRIQLILRACKGHTFRHRIDGGGLIQLYLGGVSGRAVTHSRTLVTRARRVRRRGRRTTGSIGSRSRRCRIGSSTPSESSPLPRCQVVLCCRRRANWRGRGMHLSGLRSHRASTSCSRSPNGSSVRRAEPDSRLRLRLDALGELPAIGQNAVLVHDHNSIADHGLGASGVD